jgi:hypothetical protein
MSEAVAAIGKEMKKYEGLDVQWSEPKRLGF